LGISQLSIIINFQVGLNVDEIKAMDCEILSFVASIAVEMQDLRRHVDRTEEIGRTSQSQFYKLIIQNIVEKLNYFTKLTDKMQREKVLRNTNPFRLLADDFYRLHEPANTSSGDISSIIKDSPQNRVTIKPVAPAAFSSSSSSTTSSSSLSQRYVDEVASQSMMRSYEAIAATNRQALLKESRLLRIRFGNEYQEAQRMERTVGGISSLVREFATLLEGQSELVGGIERSFLPALLLLR